RRSRRRERSAASTARERCVRIGRTTLRARRLRSRALEAAELARTPEARTGTRDRRALQQRAPPGDVAIVTKRLRLTLTANAETVETTVTFTHVEERHWQTTTAFRGMCHATAGHRDEQAALLSVTRWLRDRIGPSLTSSTTTVVGLRD